MTRNQPLLAGAKQRSSTSRLRYCKLLSALVPLQSARPRVAPRSQDKIPPVVALLLPKVTLSHQVAPRPCRGHKGAAEREQGNGRVAQTEELLKTRRWRTWLHSITTDWRILIGLVDPAGRLQRQRPCLGGAGNRQGSLFAPLLVSFSFIHFKLQTVCITRKDKQLVNRHMTH